MALPNKIYVPSSYQRYYVAVKFYCVSRLFKCIALMCVVCYTSYAFDQLIFINWSKRGLPII